MSFIFLPENFDHELLILSVLVSECYCTPEIKSGIHGRKLNEYKQKKVLKSDGKQRHRLQMDKIFYDYGYISYRELFISCESGGFATICVCYFALM